MAFGCFNNVRGLPAGDFDYDSCSCKLCTWGVNGSTNEIAIASRDRPLSMSYGEVEASPLCTGEVPFCIADPIPGTVRSKVCQLHIVFITRTFEVTLQSKTFRTCSTSSHQSDACI